MSSNPVLIAIVLVTWITWKIWSSKRQRREQDFLQRMECLKWRIGYVRYVKEARREMEQIRECRSRLRLVSDPETRKKWGEELDKLEKKCTDIISNTKWTLGSVL